MQEYRIPCLHEIGVRLKQDTFLCSKCQTAFGSGTQNGILLEYLEPLETAWVGSSVELRLRWIRQLLIAIAKIEELGYIHDDLAVRNMGVDKNDDLELFDFGSIQ